MTKFPALMLSLLLLLPAASMAAQDQPMMICGKVKNTIAYKNKKRKSLLGFEGTKMVFNPLTKIFLKNEYK